MRKTDAVITLDQMLRSYISPSLAPLGFRKTGRTYRLANERDDQALVNFQVSQASGPRNNVFFVNIAIVPRTQREVVARHYGWSASVRQSIVEGIVHDHVWPHPDVEHDNRSEYRDNRWEFTDDVVLLIDEGPSAELTAAMAKAAARRQYQHRGMG